MITARHAAALALVGWYLMMPPVKQDCSQWPDQPCSVHVDMTAPLSKWQHRLVFDSAQECQERLATMNSPSDGNSSMDNFLAVMNRNAQCVASDDPRLKGN
jgi:hypothetical protein